MSVPNQITVKIQKPKYKEKFLQIGIDEWTYAAKYFPPATFKLYLYLAGNKDNFNLELSQQAVENAIGIKKTAYHDGVDALKKSGYLKQIKGNIWSFSPAIPNEKIRKDYSANANMNCLFAEKKSFSANANKSFARAIEKQIIDNTDKIDNTSLFEKTHNDPFYDFPNEKGFEF